MIKRKFDSETYAKMGHPDLGSKIYMKANGKRRWGGVVTMLSFTGFKGASKGLILIGIEPFVKKRS
jgi:hypothetical protein